MGLCMCVFENSWNCTFEYQIELWWFDLEVIHIFKKLGVCFETRKGTSLAEEIDIRSENILEMFNYLLSLYASCFIFFFRTKCIDELIEERLSW